MTWGIVPPYDFNTIAVAVLLEVGLVALALYGLVRFITRKDQR